MSRPTTRNTTAGIVTVLLVLLPLFGSDFFVDFVMTRTLMLGLAASTLIFLSAYGGMVSLAQWLIFGVAGFASGVLFGSTFGVVGLASGVGFGAISAFSSSMAFWSCGSLPLMMSSSLNTIFGVGLASLSDDTQVLLLCKVEEL